MSSIVNTRWFALVDLGCAVISGGLLIALPQPAWWPLILALLPWAVRLAQGRFPFQRTTLDLFMALFVFTAAVGVWAAYDLALAWSKFWLLIGAVLIFYALARQPRENLWLVIGGLGVFSGLLSGYFVLTHDWRAHPVSINFINALALRWMLLRPSLGISNLDPDVVGGMVAIFAPFVAIFGWRAWRSEQKNLAVLTALGIGVIVIGLFFSAQRGAWWGLVTALSLWAVWQVSGKTGERRNIIFVGSLVFAFATLAVLVWMFPALVAKAVGPGNRLEVAANAYRLVVDFPFTGGGLNAFAGLYARYILVIPWLFLQHSSNLFLDTAIEQGVLGFITLLSAVVVSYWQVIRTPSETMDNSYWRWAVFSSLFVMTIYGLVEDPFHYGWGTLFLFVVFGLVMAVTQTQGSPSLRQANWMLIGAIATGVAVTALFFYGPLLSAWHADLGAVSMAKVELLDWPNTARWQGPLDLSEYAPAINSFTEAKQMSNDNFTATYRLGLIAAKRGDNTAAIEYWEQAQRIDPDHRGLRKELGYYYVWAGQIDQAAPLLHNITEAREEMDTYSWWWGTQGRDDLAANAAQMARRLLEP